MANDCSTTYKIVGETTELQAIYQVLNTLREQKGEDGILLADIVDYLGGDCRSMLSCRGEVTSFEMQVSNTSRPKSKCYKRRKIS